MRARVQALKRLVTLYGVVEELHSVELQRATAAVREAQQAIGVQQNAARSARRNGREALTSGDQIGRLSAEVLREKADWKRRRYDEIRLRRERSSDAAKEQYVASRLKSEQIRRVMDRVRERAESEEEHRRQAASDDRFLARRRWTDSREQLQTEAQIKGSS